MMTPTNFPLPLREGARGRGPNQRCLLCPLPPAPSRKGRGRFLT